MSIPKFNKRGVLPSGLHETTCKGFIQRFCGEILLGYKEENLRKSYKSVLTELFGLAISKGSESIIFGGSFITNKKDPHDVDCIIIVPNTKCIPSRDEHLIVSGCRLDIIYAIKENKKIIYEFMNMFSKDKTELDVGLVEVQLSEKIESSWCDYDSYENFESLLNARKAYEDRHVILGEITKGLIVSIHGFNTDAKWNYELAPIISSDNWIFAPYSYGNVKLPIINNHETKKIINDFRDWLKLIESKYNYLPNVIAHSFGTYLIGKYIKEYNYDPPVKFGNIILIGSILNSDYDWEKCINNSVVKNILNITSKNDQWVKYINVARIIKKDELYGKSGINGFNQKNNHIFNENIDIFDHGNMLKVDTFEHNIIPFFNYASHFDKYNDSSYINIEELLKKFSGESNKKL